MEFPPPHIFVIFEFIQIKYISTFILFFLFIYLHRRSDGWERPLCKFALPQCEILCPRLFIYLFLCIYCSLINILKKRVENETVSYKISFDGRDGVHTT